MSGGQGRVAGYGQLGAGRCYVVTEEPVPGMNAVIRPEFGTHVYPAILGAAPLGDGTAVSFEVVSPVMLRVTGRA